jgi:hypothetical protein
MPLALTLACLWILAAAAVAMLPMRWPWGPGLALLVLAVPLLVLVGRAHGWPWVLAVLFAVLSMFRRPLFGLVRHLRHRLSGSA